MDDDLELPGGRVTWLEVFAGIGDACVKLGMPEPNCAADIELGNAAACAAVLGADLLDGAASWLRDGRLAVRSTGGKASFCELAGGNVIAPPLTPSLEGKPAEGNASEAPGSSIDAASREGTDGIVEDGLAAEELLGAALVGLDLATRDPADELLESPLLKSVLFVAALFVAVLFVVVLPGDSADVVAALLLAAGRLRSEPVSLIELPDGVIDSEGVDDVAASDLVAVAVLPEVCNCRLALSDSSSRLPLPSLRGRGLRCTYGMSGT